MNEEAGRSGSLDHLKNIYAELKRIYYDPYMRGKNMDVQYEIARREILNATSDQQRYRALSSFVMQLEDSHTFLTLDPPVALSDYGFSFRFYGASPFITAVGPGDKAMNSGLHRGDEILKFAGEPLTRANVERRVVEFMGQHPIRDLPLEVRSPSGTVASVAVQADTALWHKMPGKEYRRLYAQTLDSVRRASGHLVASLQDRVFYWKPPEMEVADVRLGKVARLAGKHETVVLDLRGNPGGPIEQLEEVLAYFVDHEVVIGTIRTRWNKKTYKAKPQGDRFKGKLYVLVDSETGSAAEVLARLLQLDSRATVIGDNTGGHVMASTYSSGMSITVSDFVLHNGERLEGKGVQPDKFIVPTPQAIAAGDDPVLALALTHAGILVTPAEAARLSNPQKAH